MVIVVRQLVAAGRFPGGIPGAHWHGVGGRVGVGGWVDCLVLCLSPAVKSRGTLQRQEASAAGDQIKATFVRT